MQKSGLPKFAKGYVDIQRALRHAILNDLMNVQAEPIEPEQEQWPEPPRRRPRVVIDAEARWNDLVYGSLGKKPFGSF